MALIKGTCDEWEAIKETKEKNNKIYDLDEIIDRHSTIVVDSMLSGKPLEINMKKAMDFTKEIDRIKDDPVHHPSHYTDGKYECIEYIQCKAYEFELANAVKYITRAGKKSPGKEIEDIRKAIQYLEFYVDSVKGDIRPISTLDYCLDKDLSPLLTSAMMHIQDAHVAADQYKERYIDMAQACLYAYIRTLAMADDDDEMIGNRTE